VELYCFSCMPLARGRVLLSIPHTKITSSGHPASHGKYSDINLMTFALY
jgi:hypothetical protein